ncbi:MAG: hypothetical protein QGG40_05190 [Myxococcota bacterium]|jgi:hypothetical protein|nr:hypothetical protein [Myxococcota bacterium]
MRTITISLLGLTLTTGCQSDQQLRDSKPTIEPDLSLTTPAAGAWVNAGLTSVEGQSQDMQTIELDGVAAELHEDGSYTAQVALERGVNVVEAVGTDLAGDTMYRRNGVLAGDFADPSKQIHNAAGIRLNQGGIDLVVEQVEDKATEIDLNERLLELNPVYENSYEVWAWDAASVMVDVEQLSHADPVLTATPTSGLLDVSIVLPDFDVDLLAYGEVVSWDFDVEVELAATAARIDTSVLIGANDGLLVVDLAEAELELEGFTYDTSLLPDEIEEIFFVDEIRDLLEEAVLEELEDQVPELLEEVLRDLDFTYGTELMGLEIEVAAELADVFVDDDGIEVVADMLVEIESSIDQTYAGYLYAGDAILELESSSDLAVGISDDLINRMLFGAWRGGVLEMEMSSTDDSLNELVLDRLHTDEATITVSSNLPPVLVERDGQVEAQIAELMVEIETPGGELGDNLTLAVAGFADVALEVDDGAIRLDLGDLEAILEVRDNDWGASNEAITQLVEEILPIEAFLLLLGDLSIPIPELSGITVASGEVSRGDNGVGTLATIDLQ